MAKITKYELKKFCDDNAMDFHEIFKGGKSSILCGRIYFNNFDDIYNLI